MNIINKIMSCIIRLGSEHSVQILFCCFANNILLFCLLVMFY